MANAPARLSFVSDLAGPVLAFVGRWRYEIDLVALVVLSTMARLVQLSPYIAVGIDGGNYLATMRQLFGEDVSGEGQLRPPFVGIMLWPLVQALGPLTAVKVASAAVSASMAIPFYILVSRHTSRGVALLGALPFICSLRSMDAMSWGFLTLFGVSLYILAVVQIEALLAGAPATGRRVLALAGTAWLIVFSHQVTATIFVPTALAYALFAVTAGPQMRARLRPLAAAGLIAGAGALFLLPIYLHQASSVGSERFLSLSLPWQDWERVSTNLHYFLLWGVGYLTHGLAIAALAGVALLLHRRSLLAMVPIAMLAALALLIDGAVGLRAYYFIYAWFWFAICVLADALLKTMRRPYLRLVTGAALVVLALPAVGWTLAGHFHTQFSPVYYGYLTPARVSVIEAIDQLAPAGPGIAYPRGLGWWMEGIASRQVYEADRASIYTRTDRQQRTVEANAVLAGERVWSNGNIFVSDAYSAAAVAMDPAVGIDNGEFKHLLFFDDALSVLTLRDASGEARSLNLAAASRGPAAASPIGEQRTSEIDGLRVIKSVTYDAGRGAVVVGFSFEGDLSRIESLRIPVRLALPGQAFVVDSSVAAAVFDGRNHFTDAWRAAATAELSSSPTANAGLAADPAGNGFFIEVQPRGADAAIALTISVRSISQPADGEIAVQTYITRDILQGLGLRFLVADLQQSKAWFGDPLSAPSRGWLEGSPFFRRVFQAENTVAYLIQTAAVAAEGTGR